MIETKFNHEPGVTINLEKDHDRPVRPILITDVTVPTVVPVSHGTLRRTAVLCSSYSLRLEKWDILRRLVRT